MVIRPLPDYLQQRAELLRYQRIAQQSLLTRLPLPIPHDKQAEIIASPATRKVIVAGRQVGKTMLGSMSALGGKRYGGRGLFDGAKVHISSTSADQADEFWNYITAWLEPLFDSSDFYKNESKRLIKYQGGQIRLKTGRHVDALRGGNVDKLILDECAYLDPDAWKKVGAPMLAVRLGVAEFYSTPKRKNWFFQEYLKSIDPVNVRWQGWNFSSHHNPYMTPEALAALTEDMTEEDYEQEILAQFLEGDGAVFRYVLERTTLPMRKPYPGDFVFGVDWAQKRDFTVICIIDAQSREVVYYDRFKGVDWNLQRGRLRVLYDLWKPETILAEENSIGGPNIEELQREGLPVEPFTTTAKSKPELIESLVLAFDRAEIKALDDDTMRGELEAYERNVTPTGRSQYSAPAGLHDDIVIAMALAWYGVINRAVRRVHDSGGF